MPVLATTQSVRILEHRPGPLVLWHLLSLDAPTVAVLWTWFIAASVEVALPFATLLAMAIAVWLLYALDRLLDARKLTSVARTPPGLEARHVFHDRHRTSFTAGLLAGSLALAVLIPGLDRRAIHLNLLLGLLLGGYFGLIHATRSAHRLPKEIAVGIFFASAVFIPTVARRPDLRLALLPSAALFALLCSLNCLFIYRWEHSPNDPHTPPPHILTRVALRYLRPITLASVLSGAVLIASASLHLAWASSLPWTLPTACTLSALVLLLLDRYRTALSSLSLRAAADLTLLTPLLFAPALVRLLG